MKIISKYKDYYDYLQGIYGIDEKIVFDRTEFFVEPYTPGDYDRRRFHICDKIIDACYHEGEWYYGDEIKNLAEEYHKKWGKVKWRRMSSIDDIYSTNAKIVHIDRTAFYLDVIDAPKDKRLNDIHNHPILIDRAYFYNTKDTNNVVINPILKDYQMHKVFDAETMWIMISNWLSKEKEIEDNRTDKEKIIGKGFDYKHSFRNTK